MWQVREDRELKSLWGKVDKREIEKRFNRKFGTVWLRAKFLGLTKGRGQLVAKHSWKQDELEKLFQLTSKMASPAELRKEFPGIEIQDIIKEADRIECDTCYLKTREVFRKSVDVIVDVDVDLNFNIRKVGVV